MKHIHQSDTLKKDILSLRDKGKSIGFIPTMGAIHQGHLELVRQAKRENDCVVASIFVNPHQFNRQQDFDTYPERLNDDLSLLESVNCDFVFIPTIKEVYPTAPQLDYDLGELGATMEAIHRPGHFAGVVAVVRRFFEIIEPDRAYFGEKDYQQLAVIRWLKDKFSYPVEIIGVPTVRDEDGLAKSSRNFNLTKSQRAIAPQIYQTLSYCKEQYGKVETQNLVLSCKERLATNFNVEYFEIADEETFREVKDTNHPRARAFVAANIGIVRLIDNLSLTH
jgi:pantoate--beta-alanine ligase